MTTQNVNGINAANKAIKETADSVRKRQQEVITSQEESERQKREDLENAAIAARAIEQRHNDELAIISEEAAQLFYIATGKKVDEVDVPPAVVPTPPVETATTELTPESAPPAPPAEPVQTAPTAVLEPQQELGLPPAVDVTVHTRSRFNPKGWNVLQWVLALIFGLIALIIGIKTASWLVSDWNNDWWPWINTTLSVFFGIVWVIAITGIGFFGGSLLGFFVPIWYRRTRARREEERRNAQAQPVPPAPPAA